MTIPSPSSLTQTGPFSLQIPRSVGGVAGVSDGETFTIDIDPSDPGQVPITFEFDLDPDPGNVTPGNVRIPFQLSDTESTIATATMNAVKLAFPELSPALLDGPAAVEIGGFANTTVATSGLVDTDPNRIFGDNRDIVQMRSHLTQTGAAGGLRDGETFVLTDGLLNRIFEFDSDGAAATFGSVLINVNADATSRNLATTDQLAGSHHQCDPRFRPAVESSQPGRRRDPHWRQCRNLTGYASQRFDAGRTRRADSGRRDL